jgi:ubiquinone/menaquinone biosynthesis C-methylase UbiE
MDLYGTKEGDKMNTDVRFTGNPYDPLLCLMDKFGAVCSPEKFYWAVNEAYHAAESTCYDTIHSNMYEEEEQVWKRLLDMLPQSPKLLTFLDVGCGTGLVGHFVSQMCPQRVNELHLLDPSVAMLKEARAKAKGWPINTVFHHGDVFSIENNTLYDVVTLNSVLHHVVDLQPFLRRIQDALVPGGLLLIAQDPRAGAEHDSVLIGRKASITKRLQRQVSFISKIRSLVAPRIKNILGIQRYDPLIETTNKTLLQKKIIKEPMDSKSIWAVTDFHVPAQPGNFGKGIDAGNCASWMPSTKLIDTFTYHYHDTPWQTLSDAERRQETSWWMANDTHGEESASIWRKQALGELY